MRRFAAQREFASRLEVESRASGLKLSYARRPFLDQDLDRFCVAERGSRSERVQAVKLR